ncbi:DUF2625 family protein [Streptodolium elevatio]|uniref:DUF2625 family protein n=1 Tax=Streptodolium elevatio TaxID=3157996 RepID=A0ABV3DUQ4_9ACTN
MVYFAPDSVSWEPLGAGHGDWLGWLLAGEALPEFYSSVRWSHWSRDVAELSPTHGVTVYPFLWSQEAHESADLSRRPVPMHEILGISREFARQVTGADPRPLGSLPDH